MSNKPRFPFGGGNRRDDDDEDEDDKPQSSSGSRSGGTFGRGNTPSRPDNKPASRSPLGRRNDDDDEEDLDDEEEEDEKPARPANRPGGFGASSSRSPFSRSNADDDDEDEDDEEDEKPRSGFGNRPGGTFGKSNEPAKSSSSPFGGNKPGGTFGSKPNEPARPGGGFGSKPNEPAKPGSSSSFGGNKPGGTFGSKPNEPAKPGGAFGSKPNEPARPGGSGFGSKPNEPAKPGGSSPFGGNKPGGTFGSKPNEPAKPGGAFGSKPNEPARPGGSGFGSKPNEPAKTSGSSSFGGNKPGGTFGSKPNEPAKPGGAFGSKPNEPAKPGSSSPFGGNKPGSTSASSSSRPSPFGSKPGSRPDDKKDDKKDDKPGGFGGLRSPFGQKPADNKPADKKDDKPGGFGGLRSPFGQKPADNKPADKRDDKSASSGGGLRSPFGQKPAENKPADKKDDKPGGLGGLRSPFGQKPADNKPADKPASGGVGARSPFGSSSSSSSSSSQSTSKTAAQTTDKSASSSGGLFGRLPFGAKTDDKKDTGQSGKPATPGFGNKPGASPAIPPRPGVVSAPPKAGTTGTADAKKGSAKPAARGEKVARPLERNANKVQVQSGLTLDQKLDLTGYALMFFGVLVFFALIQPSEGSITKGVADFLGGLFGKVGILGVCVVCFSIGLWLFIRHFNENPLTIKVSRAGGYVLLFVTVITTVHFAELVQKTVPNMAALAKLSETLSKAGNGGGFVGGQIYMLMIRVAGEWGVPIILVAFWLVSLMLATNLTLAEISAYVKSVFHWFARVRGSYVEHRQAAAQARAAAAPLTIETPSTVGGKPAAAALAAPSSAPAVGAGDKKGLPAGTPATSNAPRLAPAAAAAGSIKSSPFGSAPTAGAAVAVADEQPETVTAPAASAASAVGTAARPATPAAPGTARPGVFGSPPAKPAEAPRSGPFGSRPAAAPAKPVDDIDDELDDDLDDEDVKSAPIVKPSPLAANKPAERPEENKAAPTSNGQAAAAKPNPFGARPATASTPAKPAADDIDDDDLDDEDEAPAKPATPVGNRPNPFGAPASSGTSSPFGARPATASTPAAPAKPAADDIDDDDLDGEDEASAKPATPVGNRPNPFGAASASPSGAAAASSAPKPANPFGAKPPTGSAPVKPNDDDEDIDDELDDDEDDAAAMKPATPVGNRPNPFAAGPKPASSNPFGARPTGAAPAKPNDDEEDLDEDDEDVEDMKPATPIGNRPAPTAPASPFGARPVPKPGLATTPKFEDDDEEEDNAPKYVPVDDDVDAPPSSGPRPTVSGPAGSSPASMPRPASPIVPRTRPGQEGAGGPSTGAPSSPFGARPAAATPAPQTGTTPMAPAASQPAAPSNSTGNGPIAAMSADPSESATVEEVDAPKFNAASAPINSPRVHPPTVNRADAPTTPSLEGVIVRSKGGLHGEVPDFHDILQPGSMQTINDTLLRQRATVIEDTLRAFGAPGNVVEINPGPVITQFGVEPGYLDMRNGKKIRIKVSQIAKLDADLALSLAARSIRIEAPVPGKGYVGIEVPNTESTLVSLHDIMDAEEFNKIKSKLRIGLGQSVDGAPIAADLTQMPHLLIAGTTGSGKSVCVNAIIACLLLQNSPDDLKFIMVDPKRVELTGYNGIPHLVSPVVVDLERIVGVLKWVSREMDERYKKFAQISARNIVDYNGKIGPNEVRLPYLVVVIDELADLMMLAPDETEKVLTRLAQMARATGIHLIISTQRPSVDVVTGLIKANFPARISFAVASSVDSRVILDSPGAEKLLGRGDMLFQSPDAAAPLRMQGVFVSDAEINRITGYWKGLKIEPPVGNKPASGLSTPVDFNRAAEPVQSRSERFNQSFNPSNTPAESGQRVFGSPTPSTPLVSRPAGTTGTNGEGGSEDDEMYEEAVELVKRAGKPSIQMLQRSLRIGYVRAARLIELMEKRGAISSADARSATATNGDEADDNGNKPQ